MNAMVVYDSKYGNTEQIAVAIGEALKAVIGSGAAYPGEVAVRHVDDVSPAELDLYDLLIVGAPTHGGRASEPAGEWLGQIPPGALQGVAVAAFDTRLTSKWVQLFGFAAKRISRALTEKGGRLVVPPEGFFVTAGEGPLLEGEEARAGEWAVRIAELAAAEAPEPA